MSDTETEDILEEIGVLQETLTAKVTQKSLIQQQKQSSDCLSESVAFANCNKSTNISCAAQIALNLNEKLIDELMHAKNEITAVLQDCDRKLKIIDEKLKQYSVNCPTKCRGIIAKTCMPYFKDKECFTPPHNFDTKIKAARQELQIIDIKKSVMWTPKDRKILLTAVEDEAMLAILKQTGNEEQRKSVGKSKDQSKGFHLPSTWSEMVGSLGEKRKFDWMKIAVGDFQERHSADECEVMWKIVLHPDINKTKWTKAEDSKLKKITKLYRYEDWDNIARELGTKRSGYQCFVRCNTIHAMKKVGEQNWTKEEDIKLCSLIKKYSIGSYIPWSQIATYIKNRTRQQIYFRWNYSLSPHLKKGRFTKEESQTLLEGVKEFGTDFCTISAKLMPNRSSVQLCHHYKTLTSRQLKTIMGGWTISDDERLLELYDQLGPKWSKIANSFAHKNRIQLRHRHKALISFLHRGISLNKIHKKTKYGEINQNDKISKADCHSNKTNEEKDKYSTSLKCNISNEICTFKNFVGTTEHLYKILQVLKANFHIPNNILSDSDYLKLVEKNKQLLQFIQDYFKCKAEERKEKVETIRLKMFGPYDGTQHNQHFIPPIPFECNIKRKRSVQSDNIDYVHNDNEKVSIDMTMDFNTPELVTNYIGSFKGHIQFTKFENFFSANKNISEKQDTVKIDDISKIPKDSTNNEKALMNSVCSSNNIINVSNTKKRIYGQTLQDLLKLKKESCKFDQPLSPNHFGVKQYYNKKRKVEKLEHLLELNKNSLSPQDRILLQLIHDAEVTCKVQISDENAEKEQIYMNIKKHRNVCSLWKN